MTIQMKTTITLNPATEFEVIEKYRQNKEYRLLSDCTGFVAFEISTPLIQSDAVYLPSGNEVSE